MLHSTSVNEYMYTLHMYCDILFSLLCNTTQTVEILLPGRSYPNISLGIIRTYILTHKIGMKEIHLALRPNLHRHILSHYLFHHLSLNTLYCWGS